MVKSQNELLDVLEQLADHIKRSLSYICNTWNTTDSWGMPITRLYIKDKNHQYGYISISTKGHLYNNTKDQCKEMFNRIIEEFTNENPELF